MSAKHVVQVVSWHSYKVLRKWDWQKGYSEVASCTNLEEAERIAKLLDKDMAR